MISTTRVLLFLPPYLVWAVAIDLLFHSADRSNATTVPLWMVIGVAVSAVGVAAAVLWFLIRRSSGTMPENRQYTYVALLAGVVVSGFVTDALEGLASVALGGHPWWLLAAIYTVGYAICCAVVALTLRRHSPVET
ncbi:hypothetical protein LV457_08705 [Mycobacterium sp. MYCO198283]|uniref:hypothetical protein n=1 Tax=Mycobacterium sp. MYCO198283 TaxID=2883505 RepID=UPI001E4C9800|nr:hypothetical protein [Mycobacterium sp. MYCO198283]MCG5432373.1 hypothetical protein [Mycobacterium sp. MYCO198283]